MASIIKRGTHGKYGTAIRKSRNTGGFLAWATIGFTEASGPVFEKQPTWFQFGDNPKETLDKLHAELDQEDAISDRA